jgi:hypothetical protein
MPNLKRSSLYRLVEGNKGRFFTVDFIKKDGTARTMNCRTGVHKDLRGGECAIPRHMLKGRPYVVVWDMVAEGYRVFNVETATSLRINGKSYKVVD